MNRFADWLYDYLPWIGIPVLVLLIFGVGYIAYREQQEWEKFAIAHNCVVTGKISPSTGSGIGFGANGQSTFTTVTISGKTGYTCDDGVTYWR